MTQPTITQTYRLAKGSELTHAELDSNFAALVAATKDNVDFYPLRANFPALGLVNVVYGVTSTVPPTYFYWNGASYTKASPTHTVSIVTPATDVVPGDTWYNPTNSTTYLYTSNGSVDGWVKIDNANAGVRTVASQAALPVIGDTAALYIAADTHKTFYWTGAIYEEASPAASAFGGHDVASAYAAGAVTSRSGYLVKANNVITAGTPFVWGTTGATWSPVVDSTKTWVGPFNAATTYPAGAVVSGSDNQLYITLAGISIASATFNPITGNAKFAWTPWLSNTPSTFDGATLVGGGQSGLVPAPASTDMNLFLRGDGTWAAAGLASWNSITAYVPGSQAVWSGYYVESNGFQTAGTPFAWGLTGSSWFPLLPSTYLWKGLFSGAGVAYAVGDVVTSGTDGALFVANAPVAVSDATYDPINGINSNVWTPWFVVSSAFIGATSVANGQAGIVPAPVAGQQTQFLRGDGAWASATASILGHTPTVAYSAGTMTVFSGYLVNANNPISIGAPFVWGTTGASWSPVMSSGFVWRGVFSAVDTYAIGDVTVGTSDGGLFVCTTAITVVGASNSPISVAGNGRSKWAPYFSEIPQTFVPATVTSSGQSGIVPAPGVDQPNSMLRGDATWGSPRLRTIAIPNQTTSGIVSGISAADTDLYDVIRIAQTTVGMTLQLAAYTVTVGAPGKLTYITNTGSAQFAMYGITVDPGATNAFIWNPSSSNWAPLVTSTDLMVGATTVTNGALGSAPQPLAGYQDAPLMGDATYDLTGRAAFVNVANIPAGGPLGLASVTVDIASVVLVNQTTAGQTIALPAPTVTAKVRTLAVVNKGSVAFAIGTTNITPGTTVPYIWSGTAWGVVGLSSSAVAIQTDTINVISANTLSTLSRTPTAAMQNIFFNGIAYNALNILSGVSISGNVITINPVTLGFNVTVFDSVTAQYTY